MKNSHPHTADSAHPPPPVTLEPVVVDRSEHIISRSLISDEALHVLYGLKEAGYRACLAGGGVRDLLLGRKPKDFDVATDARPEQIKRVFRNCRLIGRRFRLAHVIFRDTFIEVATFRANPAEEEAAETSEAPPHQFKQRDGLILRDNVFGSPAEDARRRDFTVNALFYNIADFSIIDYVGGLHDLDQRLLRVIGDPQRRFAEDPVRMIRAIRFAAVLDFEIETQAAHALHALRDKLALASRDRMYEEMRKILFCGKAENAFKAMLHNGVFDVLFPALGAWFKTPAGHLGRPHLLKMLKQIDIWKQAGLIPCDALLWTLLFGDYHEWLADQFMQEGAHTVEALVRASREHLSDMRNLIRIPKLVAHDAAHLLAVQSAFLNLTGRRPERLAERPYFKDAYVYFKLTSGLKHRNKAETAWWQDFLKSGATKPAQKEKSGEARQ